MIPLDLLGSALAAGCVGAAALPRWCAAVHSALCPLGDAAAARGVGFDAGRGALWHLAWQWPGVRWGLSRGGGVFLLGRSVLRDWARRRLEQLPKLQAVERAVSKEGLKLVLLTRLSPAFPFSLLNLAYGLSEVSLRDYSIGLIGILPGTVLFCGLGALAGDVARFGEVLGGEADAGTWTLRVVGVLATLAVVWLVSRAARRALQDVETSL